MRHVFLFSFAALTASLAAFACGGDDPAGDGSSSGSGSSSGASSTSSGGGSSGSTSSSGGASSSSSSGNPSAGCGKPGAATGFQASLSINAGGQARGYSIAVPGNYDANRKYPVVFAFHGDGGDGSSARSAFKFETAHGSDAIFVYPNGTNKTWDLDTWDSTKNKDVLLIDALVASVKSTYCVDESKVFAAGFSRGGFFANHLGCQRGGVVAAVASHGGGGPYDGTNKNYDENGNLVCPGQPIPVLLVIGANDGLLTDSKESEKFWVFKNACKAATSASAPSPCVSHQGCSKRLDWCQIPGMGHQVWAQGTEATWAFFAP